MRNTGANRSWKRFLLYVIMVCGVVAILIRIDSKRSERATPPVNLTMIGEFREWIGDSNFKDRVFVAENGMQYRIVYHTQRRILSFGPPAYLFDSNGGFADWTPDSGDVRTMRHGFDISYGTKTVQEMQQP